MPPPTPLAVLVELPTMVQFDTVAVAKYERKIPPPSPGPATRPTVLPDTVQLIMVSAPLALTAPPNVPAVLDDSVEALSVSVPLFNTPPPEELAELLTIAQALMVSVPALATAPPATAFPPVSVKPETMAVLPEAIERIRLAPCA